MKRAATTPPSLPPKKPRHSPAPPPTQWLALEPGDLKQKLDILTRTLKPQTDNDSHEAQLTTVAKWSAVVQSHLQSILDVGVLQAQFFKQCHCMLLVIASNYRDISSNPSQPFIESIHEIRLQLTWGGFKSLRNFDHGEFVADLCGLVWRALLRVAAGGRGERVEEAVLYGWIKEAIGCGVLLHGAEVWDEDDEGEGGEGEGGMVRPDGRALDGLVERRERWEYLGGGKVGAGGGESGSDDESEGTFVGDEGLGVLREVAWLD